MQILPLRTAFDALERRKRQVEHIRDMGLRYLLTRFDDSYINMARQRRLGGPY